MYKTTSNKYNYYYSFYDNDSENYSTVIYRKPVTLPSFIFHIHQ